MSMAERSAEINADKNTQKAGVWQVGEPNGIRTKQTPAIRGQVENEKSDLFGDSRGDGRSMGVTMENETCIWVWRMIVIGAIFILLILGQDICDKLDRNYLAQMELNKKYSVEYHYDPPPGWLKR